MKKLLFIVLVLVSIDVLSQTNYLYIGANRYPCTETIIFEGLLYDSDNLSVQIAKKDNSGIIRLSIKASYSEQRIRGNVYIYLEDGTVITCVDRSAYDHVNGNASTIYYLTSSEIESMKKSNIQTIRYTLKGLPGCSSPADGDFTTTGPPSFYQSYYERNLRGYDELKFGYIKIDVSKLLIELYGK